jgi:hypothetical protein
VKGEQFRLLILAILFSPFGLLAPKTYKIIWLSTESVPDEGLYDPVTRPLSIYDRVTRPLTIYDRVTRPLTIYDRVTRPVNGRVTLSYIVNGRVTLS